MTPAERRRYAAACRDDLRGPCAPYEFDEADLCAFAAWRARVDAFPSLAAARPDGSDVEFDNVSVAPCAKCRGKGILAEPVEVATAELALLFAGSQLSGLALREAERDAAEWCALHADDVPAIEVECRKCRGRGNVLGNGESRKSERRTRQRASLNREDWTAIPHADVRPTIREPVADVVVRVAGVEYCWEDIQRIAKRLDVLDLAVRAALIGYYTHGYKTLAERRDSAARKLKRLHAEWRTTEEYAATAAE